MGSIWCNVHLNSFVDPRNSALVVRRIRDNHSYGTQGLSWKPRIWECGLVLSEDGVVGVTTFSQIPHYIVRNGRKVTMLQRIHSYHDWTNSWAPRNTRSLICARWPWRAVTATRFSLDRALFSEVLKIGRRHRHGTVRRVQHYRATPFGTKLTQIRSRDPPSLAGWVPHPRAADRSAFGLLSVMDRSSWRSPVSQKAKSATLHNARKSIRGHGSCDSVRFYNDIDRIHAKTRRSKVVHARSYM